MMDGSMTTPQSLTEDERQRQIAQLEEQRDSLLRKAPFTFSIYRWIAPVFFVASTIGFFALLFACLTALLSILSSRPLDWSPLLTVRKPLLSDWPPLVQYVVGLPLLGGIAAVTGAGCWVVWIEPRPAPDDLWGYSDLVGYEEESPRDIQTRIDALRAQSTHEMVR
jgi:hypothetical protein